MIEKWERGPQRIGMVVGFIALPLLWWLQDYSLHFVLGISSPGNFQWLNYFVGGAIQGTILGAGLSKAAFAARNEDWGYAKWCLLSHGGFVLILSLFALLLPSLGSNISMFLVTNFPFQCALLMFFIGLLMRSRR